MKNASLFLALLVGLFSGHADSGERNITVPAAAETPDRCWCVYNVTNSKTSEENTPPKVEILPLGSGMADISCAEVDTKQGQPIISESICGSCSADVDELVSLDHFGVEEDLVYRMFNALHQVKNGSPKTESRVFQPPIHAWELDEGIQGAQ